MLFYWLDSEVINYLYMANVLDKLGKLAKRYSSFVVTILDHFIKEQQYIECKWNVTLISVDRMLLDNWPRLL